MTETLQQSTADQPEQSREPVAPSPEARAANRLAAETLLRCWIRERALPAPEHGELTLDLPAGPVTVPVEYWSATGMHRLGVPVSASGVPIGPAALARLLGESAGAPPLAVGQLADRTAESAERVAGHLEYFRESGRLDEPGYPERPNQRDVGGAAARPTSPLMTGQLPFLAGEQALLAGHSLHPTPKSRDRLSPDESARYSPELRGSFPLHWFAVEPEIAAHASELGPSAPALAAGLAGELPEQAAAVLVPAHPWQAAELMRRESVRRFVDRGLITPLGPIGPPWHPTSSLRTVYRPDVPVMLKLSLALNITNSRRENLRKELLRGVEGHRLFAGELGTRLIAAHPTFRILTDAAYLAVDGVPGLDVSFRHASFAPGENLRCVAGLTDLGRGAVAPDGHPHALAAHVHALAAAEGRAPQAVATDWFAQYLAVLILPLLWLDAEHGVTLEGHQQNTLIHFDGRGYPGGGWYRDNQGIYYRESAIERLEKISGQLALGRLSETVVPDDVVSERLLYYVGVNNLMGMVGALGCAGLAEERELLGLATDLLAPLRGHAPVDRLLGGASLRCKANLLTRAADLDELVGDLATQSVYVEVPNPFTAGAGYPTSSVHPTGSAHPTGGAHPANAAYSAGSAYPATSAHSAGSAVGGHR